MVRLGLAAAVILTVMGFASAPVWAEETDSTTFRIQNYIPERYRDFEWRVDGSVNSHDSLWGNNVVNRPRVYPHFLSRDRKLQDDGVSIVNDWRYRRETRQSRLISSLTLTTGLLHHAWNESDSLVSFLGDLDVSTRDNEYAGVSLAADLRGQFRKYLLADLFVEADGVFQCWYTKKDERVLSEHVDQGLPDDSGWIVTRYDSVDTRTPSSTRTIDFVGEVKVGWGRVYEGKYAATAIGVIDQFRSEGLLVREPNKDEMLTLAEFIHHYREGFNPDSREHRALAIGNLLSYLISRGVVAGENARSVLALEDVLDFFATGERSFGWSIQAGFGGHDKYSCQRVSWETDRWSRHVRWNPDNSSYVEMLNAQHSHGSGFTRSKSFNPADHCIGLAEYSMPLSSRWQLDLIATYLYYLKRNTEPEAPKPVLDERNFYDKTVGRTVVRLDADLTYYFDSRTKLSLTGGLLDTTRTDHVLSISGYYPYYFSESTVVWNVHHRRFRLGLSAAYRLSRTTTISCDWYYLWLLVSTRKEAIRDDRRSESMYFSAGITHWLF